MPTELPVLTPAVEYPKSSHRNNANRAVESICYDMGTNPKSISDAVMPTTATPASVAVILDNFANIFKTMTGAANWYSAAVPRRTFIGGGGNGSTVPASGNRYVNLNNRGLTNGGESNIYIIIPTQCNLTKFYIETLTAQGGGGSLIFQVRKNGIAIAPFTITIAAGGGAAVRNSSSNVAFQAGDVLSVLASNTDAGAASAQISGFTLELDQVG